MRVAKSVQLNTSKSRSSSSSDQQENKRAQKARFIAHYNSPSRREKHIHSTIHPSIHSFIHLAAAADYLYRPFILIALYRLTEYVVVVVRLTASGSPNGANNANESISLAGRFRFSADRELFVCARASLAHCMSAPVRASANRLISRLQCQRLQVNSQYACV